MKEVIHVLSLAPSPDSSVLRSAESSSKGILLLSKHDSAGLIQSTCGPGKKKEDKAFPRVHIVSLEPALACFQEDRHGQD